MPRSRKDAKFNLVFLCAFAPLWQKRGIQCINKFINIEKHKTALHENGTTDSKGYSTQEIP